MAGDQLNFVLGEIYLAESEGLALGVDCLRADPALQHDGFELMHLQEHPLDFVCLRQARSHGCAPSLKCFRIKQEAV